MSSYPASLSVSYGDHERTLSEEYMRRISREFQKIGVRGVSVLFASGDDGAGCHRFVHLIIPLPHRTSACIL